MVDCAMIAAQVESARVSSGMTIRALANKSGVDEAALYRVLNAQRKMTAAELVALSSVLGLTMSDFSGSEAS